jgi:predicted CoA-binding protein
MNNLNALKTLVIGASENTERYSNMAVRLLRTYGHTVLAIGNRSGKIADVEIKTFESAKDFSQIDTVTLYLNPLRQQMYYQFILDLKPRRVIFNPGTENDEFIERLENAGIATDEACTLVLLRTGQY